jgi:predicted transcriptional regulator
MKEHEGGVAFSDLRRIGGERMVRADMVAEIVARAERGEGSRRIARKLGVDRKTVRRWLKAGQWQPRQYQPRLRAIDAFGGFIERRGPEVGWNGVVLQRELSGLGFAGGYQQVQRYSSRCATGGAGRSWQRSDSRPSPASRYSVPVEYVGMVVAVNESATHYEMVHQGKVIAHHLKAQRHSVVMEPAHYHGLLKMAERTNCVDPPRFDPAFGQLGEVMVRDLAQYEAASQAGGVK